MAAHQIRYLGTERKSRMTPSLHAALKQEINFNLLYESS